jgi:hypothetical protein
MFTGPRGGTFYMNSTGNRSYLNSGMSSSIVLFAQNYPGIQTGTYSSSGSMNGAPLYTGPRGGTFYMNSKNKKSYI